VWRCGLDNIELLDSLKYREFSDSRTSFPCSQVCIEPAASSLHPEVLFFFKMSFHIQISTT
jgi:hypothetical protein